MSKIAFSLTLTDTDTNTNTNTHGLHTHDRHVIKFLGFTYLESSKTQMVPAIVLKWAKTGSLYDIVSKKSLLSNETKLKWCHQIANVITYIHDKKLIHSDIKPSNILVDEKDNIKLVCN